MTSARKTTYRLISAPALISAMIFAAASFGIAAPVSAHASAIASPFTNLKIDSQKTVIQPWQQGSRRRLKKIAMISGAFLKRGQVALLNYVPVGPDHAGRFSVQVLVASRQTRIPVEVIDAYGQTVENGELTLAPSQPSEERENPPKRILASSGPALEPSASASAEPAVAISAASTPPEKTSLLPSAIFTPSLGFSSISYQDNLGNSLSEYALTAKLSYWQTLGERDGEGSPRWSLGLSGDYTAAPFNESGASSSIRFLGVNAKIGYNLLSPTSPWRLRLAAGAYYTTTFVSSDAYGFKNMTGPELYPELQRMLSNGGAISAYVKYAPVMDQTQLTFSNTEFAGGLSYSPRVQGWTYSLDVSDLSLNQNGFTAQAKAVSLGIGLKL